MRKQQFEVYVRITAKCSCCALELLFLTLLTSNGGFAQNAIQTENAKAGNSNWQLTNPAINREIEGYTSATSVNIGASINFLVSTSDSTFKIDIYRMGWYGGAGARLMSTVSIVAGQLQTTPNPDANGRVECRWTPSYTLTVPTTWVSGIFLARLTGSSGKQSYIIFAVRDDARASAVLYGM